MALPQGVIKRIRSKVREVVGRDIVDPELFFTFDHDTQQIVSNRKIDGVHFIFDGEGNLIKSHPED